MDKRPQKTDVLVCSANYKHPYSKPIISRARITTRIILCNWQSGRSVAQNSLQTDTGEPRLPQIDEKLESGPS